MRRRALRLERYGVSENAYRELQIFCMRYPEMKEDLDALSTPASWPDGLPKGTGVKDPTAAIAEREEYLLKALRDIEQTAIEVAGELYPFLLRNVTEGVAFSFLKIPQGRNQFYRVRRRFFVLLAKKRGLV